MKITNWFYIVIYYGKFDHNKCLVLLTSHYTTPTVVKFFLNVWDSGVPLFHQFIVNNYNFPNIVVIITEKVEGGETCYNHFHCLSVCWICKDFIYFVLNFASTWTNIASTLRTKPGVTCLHGTSKRATCKDRFVNDPAHEITMILPVLNLPKPKKWYLLIH